MSKLVLVGSVPLETTKEVFEKFGVPLGPHLDTARRRGRPSTLLGKRRALAGVRQPSRPQGRHARPAAELGYKDEVMEKIMHQNAERILGL
jgi:hypothetical protein